MIPQRKCGFAPTGLGRLLLLTLATTLATLPERSPAAEGAAAADRAAAGSADTAAGAPAATAPDKARDESSDAGKSRAGTRDPAAAARKSPDPLAGTPKIKPEQTGQSAEQILARLARPRTDSWADWVAPLEPLHYCGEPRALSPCVPPPPCHPSQPPVPYDLVGDRGEPTCGPIYGGPCAPRTGTHDDGPHPRLHRGHDRFFDWFYMWK